MTIKHNFTDADFRDIGSRWLDNTPINSEIMMSWFQSDQYEGFGCGTYSFDENIKRLLDSANHKSGKLLVEGIYVFEENEVIMFKAVSLIVLECKDQHSEWEFNGKRIIIEDGIIQERLDNEPYSEDNVYKRLEEFGFNYCDNWSDNHGHLGLNEWRNRYEEEMKECGHDESFYEWFENADLIDVDQLPEPEFPGLHWTYVDFLDWNLMTDSVYKGAEEWRNVQLRNLKEAK